jgi:hypothetical protein
MPESTWRDNPWLDGTKEFEAAAAGGEYTMRRAMSVVENEFEQKGGDRHGPCRGCGGETWWKPTIGGMKCPSCSEVKSGAAQADWEKELKELLQDAAVRMQARMFR